MTEKKQAEPSLFDEEESGSKTMLFILVIGIVILLTLSGLLFEMTGHHEMIKIYSEKATSYFTYTHPATGNCNIGFNETIDGKSYMIFECEQDQRIIVFRFNYENKVESICESENMDWKNCIIRGA